MNTLLQYDLLRLNAFQKNPAVQNVISISKEGELTLLKFRPVDYFNYCIGKIESPQVLNLVRSFYSDTVEKKHQVLIDSQDYFSRSILEQSLDYQFTKKIALMKLEPFQEFKDFGLERLSLRRVKIQDILDFKRLYLESFEAENRHDESVEENFKLKILAEGTKFYFIQTQENRVGITGIYQNQEAHILSVGAVLKDFRNQGFHKAAMTRRIQACRETNPHLPIYSWAYQDSISHQNMIKSGFSISQELWAYQHVG